MKKVLIAPLDWGFGHATRCIPIIRELLDRDCTVSIAGSGDALTILKLEFPQLAFFSLPAYHPVYPSSGSMVLKMALQLPKFLQVISHEHEAIEQLVKENKFDLIISDNRYGCWSSTVPSVFVTHQINILMPKGFGWLGNSINRMNERLIRKFSFCWIPDNPPPNNLAGNLDQMRSLSVARPLKYIGHLSRFIARKHRDYKYDLTCVLSGPEPQRSIFEKKVLSQLENTGLNCFIVRGIVSSKGNPISKAVESADYLSGQGLQNVIEESTCILARSGYSTIMDLARLGKNAIFIPTPGQTEQEYLASRVMEMGIAYSMAQKEFNLREAWEKSKSFKGFETMLTDQELLHHALNEVLD